MGCKSWKSWTVALTPTNIFSVNVMPVPQSGKSISWFVFYNLLVLPPPHFISDIRSRAPDKWYHSWYHSLCTRRLPYYAVWISSCVDYWFCMVFKQCFIHLWNFLFILFPGWSLVRLFLYVRIVLFCHLYLVLGHLWLLRERPLLVKLDSSLLNCLIIIGNHFGLFSLHSKFHRSNNSWFLCNLTPCIAYMRRLSCAMLISSAGVNLRHVWPCHMLYQYVD